MFKKGQIVRVINPQYSTYGMIGEIDRNYKITYETTKVVQYGTDYITNDYIYVSFDKFISHDTNTGVFSQKDLKIISN